ncbi:hypothetical protein [Nitrosomonas sp.]|uniref:hypothetical protein n=1 Tax=Nitrosomonas sp. TaxID=42353 RepID=UPI0032EC3409
MHVQTSPTLMPGHDGIERINHFGISFRCQCWPFVVRRPRQAGNLTGARIIDNLVCTNCAITSRLANGIRTFGLEHP